MMKKAGMKKRNIRCVNSRCFFKAHIRYFQYSSKLSSSSVNSIGIIFLKGMKMDGYRACTG